MEATATSFVDSLSYEELRGIVRQPSGLCVSLFLPIQRGAPGSQPNASRLGHMLHQAERLLHLRGETTIAIGNLLAPAWQICEDLGYWAHQGAGLAILVGAELLRVYRLLVAVEELVVVDDRPQIVPLLPLIQNDGRLYVLSLGLERAELLLCTRYDSATITLRDLPASLKESLKYDEFAKQPQLHPGVPGHAGERGAIFHGQGARDDMVAKQEIGRYFQQIDQAVLAALRDARAPLVLAGLGYLLPIYRAVNSYANLTEAGIPCNPSNMSAAELRAQAWAIVAPGFEREHADAAERFRLIAATEPARATSYMRAIVPAAWAGRIATLFVGAGQRRWGRFDPASGVLSIHELAEAADTELVNLAAAHTLIHGGAVHVVTPDQLAAAAPLAAVLRY
jgi:hypothetical protein